MPDVSSSYGPGEGVWPPPEPAPASGGVRRRLLRLVRAPRPAEVEADLMELPVAQRARALREMRTRPARTAVSVLASLGAASCTITGVHMLAGDGWALLAGGAFLLLLERRLS